MMPYDRLEAGRSVRELAVAVYSSTRTWPAEEQYGLTRQVRRAAISVGANLAEGAARFGKKEFKRFVDISLGSLSELSYLLRIASDLCYLSPEEFTRLDGIRNQSGKLLYGLARSLARPDTDSAAKT